MIKGNYLQTIVPWRSIYISIHEMSLSNINTEIVFARQKWIINEMLVFFKIIHLPFTSSSDFLYVVKLCSRIYLKVFLILKS